MIIKSKNKKNTLFARIQKVFSSNALISTFTPIIAFSFCSFILGVFLYREGYINTNLRQLLSTTYKIPQKYFSSLFTDVEIMYIDINYKNFEKIAYQREKALYNNRHVSSEAKYVPAKITYRNTKMEVKLKLKGAHSDHWIDENKWSLKVKVKNNHTIDGMKIFSIMQPFSRGYIYEWIYQKLLKEEGFIHKRIKYINVVINGKDNGIYILEEEPSF